jgi:kynurenine formamidase
MVRAVLPRQDCVMPELPRRSGRIIDLSHTIRAPFLAPDGVDYLLEQGVVLVGIDSLNIDDTEGSGERPAHSGFLGAGVHVVEHLTNLGALPETGATFTAVPPKIERFGTFPVRAFASLP